jgi:hypothetical protein
MFCVYNFEYLKGDKKTAGLRGTGRVSNKSAKSLQYKELASCKAAVYPAFLLTSRRGRIFGGALNDPCRRMKTKIIFKFFIDIIELGMV